MTDINDWLIFSQIVDNGGLSAASRRLGVPKSTLSRRLSKLEAEFGCRLLNRKGRSFELTDAGKRLYQEAHNLTEQVMNAKDRLTEASHQESGTIRMAAPITPGGQFLGVWLAEFMQRYPHIRIELDLSDRMTNLFEQPYDIALRVGPLADSSLIARKLGTSERLLVASPQYLQAHGLVRSPNDLSEHKCIGFSEQLSGHGSWLLLRGKQTQRINFYPTLRCDDMATILQLTRSGAGIAMIPAFVCKPALNNGQLQRILTQWHGPAAEFYLVFAEKELMPKRVRLLADFLIERARSDKSKLFNNGCST